MKAKLSLVLLLAGVTISIEQGALGGGFVSSGSNLSISEADIKTNQVVAEP